MFKEQRGGPCIQEMVIQEKYMISLNMLIRLTNLLKIINSQIFEPSGRRCVNFGNQKDQKGVSS